MPLATEETTVGGAIEAVREYIDAIDAELDDDDLDTETDYAAALRNQRGTLEHYRAGLVWARDEAGWGADTGLVLGAPTAAEEALMDRERPRDASAADGCLLGCEWHQTLPSESVNVTPVTLYVTGSVSDSSGLTRLLHA